MSAFAWSLTAATVLGLCLQLHGAAQAPLNYDEGATLYFARLPIGALFGRVGRLETNPPLFYLIEHLVIRLAGESPLVLRSPGIVCATLCVPAAGLLSRALAAAPRTSGSREGLVAALLVATSAGHVVTAQDARTYAVLALACLVASGAAVIMLKRMLRGEAMRVHEAVCYAACCVAALYLHNTAILLVAACNAAALAVWLNALRKQETGGRARFARQWCLPNLAILAAWLPWLPVVLDQTTHRLAHFWLPVPGLADLRYAVLNIYGQPYLHVAQPLPDLIFVAAGILGVWRHRADRVLVAFAILLLAGIPLASFALSQWRPIMNGKTWEWLLPPFMILVAQGCTWNRRLALPGAPLLAGAQVSACLWMFANRPDEAYPAVAATLAREAQPGDVLYTAPASNLILLRQYGFDARAVQVFAPSGDDPWFESGQAATLAGDQIGPCLGGRSRLWLLTRGPPAGHASLQASLSPPALKLSDRRFGRGRMRNLELSLLEAGTGKAEIDRGACPASH